jgi:RNA polymerase sigma-70 factor (ECF subfamily)
MVRPDRRSASRMVPALNMQSSPPEQDPAELASVIARATVGEEEAWRELLDLYSRRVFAMARSRLHSDELAEEITQSVFVTVATKLNGRADGSGYSEQGKFEPWLFRITMNRVRDYCRKRARHATPTAPEHLGGVSAEPEINHAERDAGMSEMNRLRGAMSKLSERDREIIELRHHGQLSFKQIAEISGDPIGTLLARHHRALKKLRDILEPQHPPQSGSGEAS